MKTKAILITNFLVHILYLRIISSTNILCPQYKTRVLLNSTHCTSIICKAAYLGPRCIISIHQHILVKLCSFVLTSLDNFNLILSGCLNIKTNFNKFKRAAQTIHRVTRSEYATHPPALYPTMAILSRLDVLHYVILTGSSPIYLSHLTHVYTSKIHMLLF